MAFPVAASRTDAILNQTAANFVNIPLPATINAGDLLLVVVVARGNPTNSSWNTGFSSLWGWAGDSNRKWCAGWKIADGTEDGANVTLTHTGINLANYGYFTYRITGAHPSQTPAIGTNVSGASPDPPNCAPSWGAEDNLWIAAIGQRFNNRSVNSYPSNYTGGFYDTGSGFNDMGIGAAYRQLNAASENPGAFTLSASFDGCAQTIAIRPAPASARSQAIIIT